jgi:hypothetical protein
LRTTKERPNIFEDIDSDDRDTEMELREELDCVDCIQVALERLQWGTGANTLLLL